MTSTSPRKPVLLVLTSHGTKGSTGEPTGFYLGELTHPLAELEAGGIPWELASIAGGEPPVDGLDLDDPVNARYWNDAAFREALRHTRPLGEVDSAITRRSSSPAATARCGTFRPAPTCNA